MKTSPEVLSVVGDLPPLREFLTSLYDSRYKEFFQAFGTRTVTVAIQFLLPRWGHPIGAKESLHECSLEIFQPTDEAGGE